MELSGEILSGGGSLWGIFQRGGSSTGEIFHGGIITKINFLLGNFPLNKLSIGGKGSEEIFNLKGEIFWREFSVRMELSTGNFPRKRILRTRNFPWRTFWGRGIFNGGGGGLPGII